MAHVSATANSEISGTRLSLCYLAIQDTNSQKYSGAEWKYVFTKQTAVGMCNEHGCEKVKTRQRRTSYLYVIFTISNTWEMRGTKKSLGKIKLLQVHVSNHRVTPLKLQTLDVVPG